jgi:hypothetical protein
MIFGKKVTEHHFFIFSAPFYEELNEIILKMYIGLYVKYPVLIKLEFFSIDFRNIFKFHEILSCGSQNAPFGRKNSVHDESNIRV